MTKKGKLRRPCTKCRKLLVRNTQAIRQKGCNKKRWHGMWLRFAPIKKEKACLSCAFCDYTDRNPSARKAMMGAKAEQRTMIREAKAKARRKRMNSND